MKYIIIALLTFLTFDAQAQNNANPALLNKMIGEWEIEGRIRMNPNDDFRSMKGEATFELLYGDSQVKESFKLGDRFSGQAFINFAAGHDRFELFQIDMMSSRRSTIVLKGAYDEDTKRLNFAQIQDYPQWGQSPLEIRWEYIFFEDGSFKKEMYSKDPSGKYYLQSDYHYKAK